VHLFHLRLSASGKAVMLAFLSPDQTVFLEGHAIAFACLGGVPGRIRYDNLTSAVTQVLVGRDRTETDRFIALHSQYGFDPFFCIAGSRGPTRRVASRARWAASADATSWLRPVLLHRGQSGAHEKGGVEGEVGRFRRRHLVPVPKVADMAAFDAHLVSADRRDDGRRITGRAQTVEQAFAAEPPKARICVRQRWYSVPARLAGREVGVRLGARHVEVLADGHLVARHERSPRKGTQTLALDHYLEVLVRKPGARPSALSLAKARASGVITPAHERFSARARKKHGDATGTRAVIEVLLLHRNLPFIAIHAALTLSSGCARPITSSWPSRPAGSPTGGARPRSPPTGPSVPAGHVPSRCSVAMTPR
jgi:hypothetical protein